MISADPELLHVESNLIVADKPSGLLSVPGRGPAMADCLVARIARRFADVFVVHRLDMATSGLIVLARGASAQRTLAREFRERRVEKRYIAEVIGHCAEDQGAIELPIGADWNDRPRRRVDLHAGKAALTRYRVISRLHRTTLLELQPVTGRTHQLRVHLAAIGHPIRGDALYAPDDDGLRLMLHACFLAFSHPATGEILHFHSPSPFAPTVEVRTEYRLR